MHSSMRFVSTRGNAPATPIDDALAAGLAPDGGLFVPETIPVVALTQPQPTLADTAQRVLAPYFAQSSLRERLGGLCTEAFSFDAPLRPLAGDNDYVLELFHGPTAAFKD